ncbi:hypothetical protein AMET1_0009 [Methanonatronarchaeum thermophilum]|uniref:Uncharacterized protein n=1 Tax=Methanonatronarchaeum thermophilum TaxID=1927129 RepID=A0A1Y3GDL0_9EURY|nr:hypothetical protein [Methanonatronarchaeum thermophilum]OUJ19340.1 hypothetical protein AMET1_0009 [Methanonatronarchaeum thermophilum]
MSFAGIPFEEEAIEAIVLLIESGVVEDPEVLIEFLESKGVELPEAAKDALTDAPANNGNG